MGSFAKNTSKYNEMVIDENIFLFSRFRPEAVRAEPEQNFDGQPHLTAKPAQHEARQIEARKTSPINFIM